MNRFLGFAYNCPARNTDFSFAKAPGRINSQNGKYELLESNTNNNTLNIAHISAVENEIKLRNIETIGATALEENTIINEIQEEIIEQDKITLNKEESNFAEEKLIIEEETIENNKQEEETTLEVIEEENSEEVEKEEIIEETEVIEPEEEIIE